MYILYKKEATPPEEREAITKVFKEKSFFWSSHLPRGTDENIVTRYCSIPYPKSLEDEIVSLGLKSLQPASSTYSIISCEWYNDIKEDYKTPKTWFNNFASLPNKQFVVKGETNSKKFLWNTHMFASDRKKVQGIISNLCDDSLIGEQNKIVREYWEIEDFGIGHKDINGCPIGDEWRTIWINNKLVAAGYYWVNHIDFLIEEMPNKKEYLESTFEDIPEEALLLGESVSMRLGHPFVCIDLAKRKSDSEWFVVEVNDGTMSGLPNCDPVEFYQRVANTYVNKKKLVSTYL